MKQFAITGILVAGLGLAAQANTIQIGTGLSTSGAPLLANASEVNYTVTGGDPSHPTTAGQVYDANTFPLVSGPWVPNQPTGQWITPIDPQTQAPSLLNAVYFDYSRTIYVASGLSGNLVGAFASDNPGALFVNDKLVANTEGWYSHDDTQDYSRWVDFNINLIPGVNTIEFEVYNIPLGSQYSSSSGNPTGLIAYGTATGVPDGGMTAGLLGGALIGLQMLRRRMFC